MNTNRVTLTQLADHLEKGKCIHTKFDFNTFNDGKVSEKTSKYPGCGTLGCAIGELPALDNRFHFMGTNRIDFEDTPIDEWFLAKYFFLDVQEIIHLFYARGQTITKYGGNFLMENATKAEVIHNIREFVRITGKN